MQFHLEQAKQRATNRLREQRPKAIDLLARTVHLAEEFGIDAEPPYALFDRLTLTEIRELARGIQDFKARSAALWIDGVVSFTCSTVTAARLSGAAGCVVLAMHAAGSAVSRQHTHLVEGRSSVMVACNHQLISM